MIFPCRERPRIGVFGHVGNNNLGDEAIIAAVIENIRKRIPQADIIGFTINPEDTKARHGIPAFPIRKTFKRERRRKSISSFDYDKRPNGGKEEGRLFRLKMWIKMKPRCFEFLLVTLSTLEGLFRIPGGIVFFIQCYVRLRGVHLLIVAGSQQLIDYVGGPWAFPYTLLKWLVAAKVARTKVAFMSVGAGPINTQLGRVFIRRALSLASYRTYRDETSRKWIKQLNLKGNILIRPDLALSSMGLFNLDASKAKTKKRPVVGVNMVPFSSGRYWVGGSRSAYKRYIEKIALFGTWLIEKGYTVHLFPTQLNLDPQVIADVRGFMRENTLIDLTDHIVDKSIRSLEELMDAIYAMEVVVASRYHGCVLAYALNKRVMGIAYQRKTADLMRVMGQAEYCLDIEDMDVEEMKRKFEALQNSPNGSKEEIERKISIMRDILSSQYDEVIGLLKRK